MPRWLVPEVFPTAQVVQGRCHGSRDLRQKLGTSDPAHTASHPSGTHNWRKSAGRSARPWGSCAAAAGTLHWWWACRGAKVTLRISQPEPSSGLCKAGGGGGRQWGTPPHVSPPWQWHRPCCDIIGCFVLCYFVLFLTIRDTSLPLVIWAGRLTSRHGLSHLTRFLWAPACPRSTHYVVAALAIRGALGTPSCSFPCGLHFVNLL